MLFDSAIVPAGNEVRYPVFGIRELIPEVVGGGFREDRMEVFVGFFAVRELCEHADRSGAAPTRACAAVGHAAFDGLDHCVAHGRVGIAFLPNPSPRTTTLSTAWTGSEAQDDNGLCVKSCRAQSGEREEEGFYHESVRNGEAGRPSLL